MGVIDGMYDYGHQGSFVSGEYAGWAILNGILGRNIYLLIESSLKELGRALSLFRCRREPNWMRHRPPPPTTISFFFFLISTVHNSTPEKEEKQMHQTFNLVCWFSGVPQRDNNIIISASNYTQRESGREWGQLRVVVYIELTRARRRYHDPLSI